MSNKITTSQETNQKNLFQDLMNRRVPHIIGFYLAAGWAVLQFIDWMVNRYILSPHLVEFTLTSLVSFIPSILILAYFHGTPGKDGWTKIEKIGIPVNISASILILFIFFSAEDLGAATETVLVENENGEMMERVIPKAIFRKNIAIFNMKNNISDTDLNWIGHGLTLALNVDLCQEMFIDSHSGIYEKLIEKKFYEANSVPLTIKREISKELHVEYFFGGDVSKNKNGEFIVNTTLHRTRDGKILAKNTFKDENIFSIIDQISVQIKYDMEIPTAHIENAVDFPVTEITTESLNALEYWAKGYHLFVGNNYDEGIAFMEKAIQDDETFGMAWFYLQGLYVMNNQGDKRLETINKAMEYIYKIPERFEYLVKLVYFESSNEPEKVFQVIKMHLDLFPEDITALEIMFRIYLSHGNYEVAINQLKIILEIDPSRHEYLLQIGRLTSRLLGDDDEALKYYEKYLDIYPEDVEVHLLIGKIYKNEGESEKARGSFEKVLVLDPNNINAFISILEMDYEGLEQIEETYKTLDVCKNAKDSVNVYHRIENELKEHGRFGELMMNFEEYRKLYPSFSTFMEYAIPHLLYPVHYIKINQNEKAFALMEEFKNSYQAPFDSYIDMGYLLIYAELDDVKNASIYLDKIIETATSMSGAAILDIIRTTEAKVYRLNGDYNKAIEILVSSTFSDTPEYKHEMARCYRLKGEYNEALYILKDYQGKNASFELGMIYHAMGEIDESINYMIQFIDDYKNADPEFIKVKKAKAFINKWKNQS